MQPTLRPAQYLHGLRAKTHFLLELTVHRLLGVLVAVHTTLGKLPRVSAIDSATPKHPILCIANHDATFGLKPSRSITRSLSAMTPSWVSGSR